MVKKIIKYEDYNGDMREEEFCFNLKESEIQEWALSVNGGMDKLLMKMIQEHDNANLAKLFKELILKSYGERSLDGKYFRKTDENGMPLSKNFYETEAYSVLITEIMSSAENAAAFVNALIPKNLREKVDKQVAEQGKNVVSIEQKA